MKEELEKRGIGDFFKDNAEFLYIIGIFMIFINGITIEVIKNQALLSYLWFSSSILVTVLLILVYNNLFSLKYKSRVMWLAPLFVIFNIAFVFQFLINLGIEENRYSLILVNALMTNLSNNFLGLLLLAIFLIYTIINLYIKLTKKKNKRSE